MTKNTFQARNLGATSWRGSGEGSLPEDQGMIPLRKNSGVLGHSLEKKASRVMVYIWGVRVFESGGNGGSIACHDAWSQLLVLEEVGEELCYQGNTDSERICLLSTTPGTEDSPLSPICCLPGESGLAKRPLGSLSAWSCSLPGSR